jgi:hypothetical protein
MDFQETYKISKYGKKLLEIKSTFPWLLTSNATNKHCKKDWLKDHKQVAEPMTTSK